jgi:hypothetical protein
MGGFHPVNPEARLADIITALEVVGLNCLVMGGHAVRFYGLDRNTVDYDLHLAPDGWDDLPHKLSQAPLFASQPLIEGPSWRPNTFRRFQIECSRAGVKSGSNSGARTICLLLLLYCSPGANRANTAAER